MIDSDVEPYFNRYLHSYFSPYFNKIAAWYWGHEHSFAIYQDGIFGLAKGRLLGSSSYKAAGDSSSNNALMMASYDQNNNDNNWNSPVAVSSNGNTVFTAHGPSLTVYSGTYYLIYADASNGNKVGFISSTDLKNWSKALYVKCHDQFYSSNSAISSVWIGNTCYLCFQDAATHSITLVSTDMSAVSTISVPNLPSGPGTPTLAASGSNLYLFYRYDDSNSSYVYWQIYNTSSGVWTDKGCVTNNGVKHSVGTPKATSSVAVVVEANGDITILWIKSKQ